MSSTIENWRKSIDSIDAAIVDLLAKRFKVTQEVGVYKKNNNLPPQDISRETELFSRIESYAKKNGLNPEFTKKIFRLIVDEVIENHKKISAK